MRGTFICRLVKRNNGILQVQLTSDIGAPHQPTEIWINVDNSTGLHSYTVDKRYFVEILEFRTER